MFTAGFIAGTKVSAELHFSIRPPRSRRQVQEHSVP
jgi:hypothetical protein